MQAGWAQTSPGAGGNGSAAAATVQVSITGTQVSDADAPATVARAAGRETLLGLDALRNDPRFAGIDGRGYAVAVLDTGLDLAHPFFGPDRDGNGVADSILFQYDFVDNDAWAEDRHGHGTHVAGLIASQDGTYRGTAPGAGLIVLRVLDAQGNGSLASVERALQWVARNAAAYNIVAVNMSLGDNGNYPVAQSRYGIGDELSILTSIGVTVVSAAGNNYYAAGGREGAAYPAADPNSLGVGAVWGADEGGPHSWRGGGVDFSTGADRLVSFSQRAAGQTEVFAPGALVTGAGLGGGTATFSGTSMAAPQVTGVTALAQQVAVAHLGRLLTVSEIRSLLASTGRAVYDGDDENDNVPNSGRVYRRLDVHALAEAILLLPRGTGTTPAPGGGPAGDAGGRMFAAGTRSVSVGAGEVVGDMDFGNFRLASVSGKVFDDVNGDGTQGAGEAPVAGRLMFLDADGNGLPGASESATATDGAGSYRFDGLLPGTYSVRLLVPPGHEQTAPAPGTGHAAVVSSSGQALTGLDFGERKQNRPPVLQAIDGQAAAEGSLLTFTARATDADVGNTLTFSLVGGPSGASINAETGLFIWTPTEAQGPASYTFTVRVTDNGAPNLFDEEAITITVNEFNVAPVLAAIGNKSINEGSELTFTSTATDDDLPANTLTFSLIGAPAGATINPATGAFSWSPTEGEGPGSFPVTVRVTDNGSPALSDEETITISVNEVNEAPVLAAIADQIVDEQTQLAFTATATDTDLPANTLTFSLDPGAPAGATIDPLTGVFTWTPTEVQGPGSYDIKVRVSDGALTDVQTIVVTVTDVNEALQLTGFDVQKGQTQRSFVRYLDLAFAESGPELNALLSAGRVQLTRYNLDGSGTGTQVDLNGVLSVAGNTLNFDFGAQGIGGNGNSIAGDGYYTVLLDLDGNGSFETTRRFYRLLGDVNGDRTVTLADAWQIFSALGSNHPEWDVNGSGRVDLIDAIFSLLSLGRKLDSHLLIDD
jgi:subtilisin family serine protease